MTGRTHKRLFAIGITIALLAATAWGEERTWTDDSDAFTLVAELVEVRGDEVVLRRQDGKQITVPLAKLSKKDLLFLVQRKEGDSSEAEKPFNGRPPGKPELVDTIKKLMTREQVALGGPIVNTIDMVLVPIPPGEFMMGSPKSEADRYDDETQHLVRITKPFYLSANEVTQVQYEQVVDKNPSYFSALGKGKDRVSGDTSQLPVEQVNWHEAVAFCGKLSEREGVEYRLPTEAEWEYACRAGTTTTYSFGNNVSQLGEYAWYDANIESRETTHPVGEKLPNAWGLFDMHGNVYEWCQDLYGPYESLQVVSDPTGPASSGARVLRGGAFVIRPKSSVRAAYRTYYRPGDRNHNIGFRLARTYPLSP